MTDSKKADDEQKTDKKDKKDKATNVKIYGRVRALMPWEPREISLQVKGNLIRNTTEKTTNEYSFNKVYGVDVTNEEMFKSVVEPMIDNVLNGFNAVLIAYGQTGSGKTFSMLGKPHLGIVGLLPMMLQTVIQSPNVSKVELLCVEAFGHHVARIELFDLYDPDNQTPNWAEKKGDTGLEPNKALTVTIKDIDDAYEKIKYAHAASHFAPTGKNPESSRGHVTFVAKVHQPHKEIQHASIVSYFVMVDCAGSEGESAFTPDFIEAVDKTTLMARRLEAGCINTGLSQLQIIFNELRYKGILSNMVGNGLRRVLHPYINTKTFLSVLFTFSPSVNNAKATESTLKFAVTAGMVKVKPVKAELALDFEKLVAQLRQLIEENDKLVDTQNDKITDLQAELETLRQQGIAEGNLPEDFTTNDSDEETEPMQSSSGKKKRVKGTSQSTLPQNLLSQLAEFDAEDDQEYELDEMFVTTSKNEPSAKEIEKEMEDALKRMQKVAKGADLVKSAIEMDEKAVGDEKTKNAMDQLSSTLAAANADVTEMDEDNKENEIDAYPELHVDLDAMKRPDLETHVEETWGKIETNRVEQTTLKKQQQKVVDHLVETNEWLFNALNEILNSSIAQ